MRLILTLILALTFLLVSVPLAAADHVPADRIQWACGFGPHHPDYCGINAIHEPVFSDEVWIDEDEQILGLVFDGEARAYPIRMLDRHEMVMDEVAGIPLAITWCPLCGSGLSFLRTVTIDGEERILDFEVSGFLYQHDLVMWDRQTRTLWNQVTGTPIATLDSATVSTDHLAARLTLVPVLQMPWADWVADHPDSLLLQPVFPSYAESAYGSYDTNCNIGVTGAYLCEVQGLHPKEQVLGVSIGDRHVAYQLAAVEKAGGIVQDLIGADRVIVSVDGTAARVFDTDGFRFSQDGADWVDEDGLEWDLTQGTRSDGGAQLNELDSLVLYWFAWEDHHEDTRLWSGPEYGEDPISTVDQSDGPNGVPGDLGRDQKGGKLPGIGVVMVLLVGLVVVSVVLYLRK